MKLSERSATGLSCCITEGFASGSKRYTTTKMEVMNMSIKYEDLMGMLAEVRRSVLDNRFIWCVAADGFETSVSYRTGLLLGGALSPYFLRDDGWGWDEVPWVMWLRRSRLVVIENAIAPVSEWVPLMEEIAKNDESMLIVTQEISGELVRVLLVNSLKGTIQCSAAGFAEDHQIDSLCAATFLGKPAKNAIPKRVNKLPVADEVWIRRDATVVFSPSEENWRSSENNIAVIAVGGENCDEQRDRLRFLVREIQSPMEKSA